MPDARSHIGLGIAPSQHPPLSTPFMRALRLPNKNTSPAPQAHADTRCGKMTDPSSHLDGTWFDMEQLDAETLPKSEAAAVFGRYSGRQSDASPQASDPVSARRRDRQRRRRPLMHKHPAIVREDPGAVREDLDQLHHVSLFRRPGRRQRAGGSHHLGQPLADRSTGIRADRSARRRHHPAPAEHLSAPFAPTRPLFESAIGR